MYLSRSAFLASLTPPNKQSFQINENLNLVFINNNKTYSIRRSIICVFCFKQRPLNTKQKLEFLYYLFDKERLLSVVVRVVIFLSDKPLDFIDTIFSVLLVFLKYIKRLNIN